MNEQFKEQIKKELMERLGSDFRVDFKTMCKANRTYTGLVIHRIGTTVAPIIAIESFCQKFIDGISVEVIANEVMDIYNMANQTTPSVDIENMLQDSKKYGFRMIGIKNNQQYLKEIDYIKIADDYALIPIIYAIENGVIAVKKDVMKRINITIEEFIEIAKKNEYERGILIQSLKRLTGFEDDLESELYVVTFNDTVNGACAIVYEDILEKVSKKMGSNSFYILPSSVHETICVQCADAHYADALQLKLIVQEINATMVSEDDILGDTVLLYDHNSKKIVKMV